MTGAVLVIDRLKQLLEYDPDTGKFRWLVARSRLAQPGSIAGRVSKSTRDSGGGYRWIGIDGKEYLAHRLAWLYVTGKLPEVEIDHVNTERDDNRFCNLRLATDSENAANRCMQSNNTTGFKGVSFNKNAGKFVASIQRAGHYHYLGLFETAERAHAAYVDASKKLFGNFARAS